MQFPSQIAALALALFALPGLAQASSGAAHAPAKATRASSEAERPSQGPAHAATGTGHWSYEGATGPDNWGELSPDFRLCKAGHMQSPIDLGGSEIPGRFVVRAAYKPSALMILNNGHTVQVSIPEGSTMSSGIQRYKLLQIHFHTPSEETIYGVHYPMVAHFVHVDHAGNYAVLGVLFEEGMHNPELDKLIKAAPAHETPARLVAGVTFDPSKLLPANLAVYRFEGSLTTPPCTEGVHWHVATHPVTASAAQIGALHAILGDNARPTQPLHGRLLVSSAD